VPYTNLTYFKVIDKNTTNQIEEYIKNQIEFSTRLCGEASFERSKFFNTMNQKIDYKMLKLLL
jgi:septin family protein